MKNRFKLNEVRKKTELKVYMGLLLEQEDEIMILSSDLIQGQNLKPSERYLAFYMERYEFDE